MLHERVKNTIFKGVLYSRTLLKYRFLFHFILFQCQGNENVSEMITILVWIISNTIFSKAYFSLNGCHYISSSDRYQIRGVSSLFVFLTPVLRFSKFDVLYYLFSDTPKMKETRRIKFNFEVLSNF